jgi:hypothetical protein
MSRRFGAISLALFGAWVAGPGCAASGSTNQVNGPNFDVDAGEDAGSADDASAPSDGPPAPPGDSSSPRADGAGAPETGSTADGSSIDGSTLPEGGDASGGSDAGEAGACTSTTAVFGGNGASLLFGATATGSGSFGAAQTVTGTLAGTPALVAFGGGFQALFQEAIDAGGAYALYATGFAAGTWSLATALGGAADAIDPPAVGVVGTTLQSVYLNGQNLYYQVSFATTWTPAAVPVRPPDDAGVTAFGPVGAAAAGTATQLVIAYEGHNQLPYAQTWTSGGGGWDDGVALGTADVAVNTQMAIAALEGEGSGVDGGTTDLIVIYVDGEGSGSPNNLHLFYVLRNASTKAWSSPAMVDVNAYTNAGDAPTLTALSGGRALVAWQGYSGGAYGSVFTAGASSAWSTPFEITSATTTSAPSLAPGVCGDDAEAAYVSNANVYTTHFAGGIWTAPTALAGGAGATAAAIATSP